MSKVQYERFLTAAYGSGVTYDTMRLEHKHFDDEYIVILNDIANILGEIVNITNDLKNDVSVLKSRGCNTSEGIYTREVLDKNGIRRASAIVGLKNAGKEHEYDRDGNIVNYDNSTIKFDSIMSQLSNNSGG